MRCPRLRLCLAQGIRSSSTARNHGNCLRSPRDLRGAELTAHSHGIPQSLRQLFNSQMTDTWRIAQPYCVALAPSAKSFKNTEPLWYAGCKTLSGEDKLYYTQGSFETTYVDLTRWLKGLTNAPRSCFLTFGPNQSYFACAASQGSIWGGIPSELEDKVRKSYDTPLCVGLGKHNAWVVLYPDGYLVWKFYGHYSALDKILKDATPGSVAVSLHASTNMSVMS